MQKNLDVSVGKLYAESCFGDDKLRSVSRRTAASARGQGASRRGRRPASRTRVGRRSLPGSRCTSRSGCFPHVWNLRSRRSFRVIGHALELAAVRFETRLCEFSIQGNHIHLVVEARGPKALSQAMQGLGVRVARGLNRMMDRRGRVFADRYHAHVLRTPTEVKRAVHYVRNNFAKHTGARYVDEYSSANPAFALPRPASWLLRRSRE